jgi:hypothetical protein
MSTFPCPKAEDKPRTEANLALLVGVVPEDLDVLHEPFNSLLLRTGEGQGDLLDSEGTTRDNVPLRVQSQAVPRPKGGWTRAQRAE